MKDRWKSKFFHLDGRYDVIGTGSLLGVRGYGKEPKSIPVGYETTIDMSPLDFEEFLWANGVSEIVIDSLKKNITQVTPVPAALHKKMRQLLLQYTVVGGMPDVVQTFVDTKRLDKVLNMQRDIVRSYEDDMIKYANQKDKSRILECFQSIPKQLSKENKKFQYSVVKKGSTASKYAGSLQWIEDAGIISRCYNLISDMFTKMGRKLYYFHKNFGLEVEFVIRYKGECTLVEVKVSSGNTKSTKTILAHPEKYHVNSAIKFGDYNVGKSGSR